MNKKEKIITISTLCKSSRNTPKKEKQLKLHKVQCEKYIEVCLERSKIVFKLDKCSVLCSFAV